MRSCIRQSDATLALLLLSSPTERHPHIDTCRRVSQRFSFLPLPSIRWRINQRREREGERVSEKMRRSLARDAAARGSSLHILSPLVRASSCVSSLSLRLHTLRTPSGKSSASVGVCRWESHIHSVRVTACVAEAAAVAVSCAACVLLPRDVGLAN